MSRTVGFRNAGLPCTAVGIVVLVLAQIGAAHASPGDLDPAFGGKGIVKAKAFSSLSAVASDGNGAAIVAGSAGDEANSDILVGRYLADGTLDGSFGTAGLRRVETGVAEIATDVAVAADGSVWIGGAADGRFLIARLTPGGALDTSFNETAFLIDPGRGVVSALAAASAGRVVALDGGAEGLAVIRLLPTGAPDHTFGQGGVRNVPIEATSDGASVAIASDDSLVVAGAEVARLRLRDRSTRASVTTAGPGRAAPGWMRRNRSRCLRPERS